MSFKEFKPLVDPSEKARYLAVPEEYYEEPTTYTFYEVFAVIKFPCAKIPLIPSEGIPSIAPKEEKSTEVPLSVNNFQILHLRIRRINFPILLAIAYGGAEGVPSKVKNFVSTITTETEEEETDHFVIPGKKTMYIVYNPWNFTIPGDFCKKLELEVHGYIYYVKKVVNEEVKKKIIEERLYKVLPVLVRW